MIWLVRIRRLFVRLFYVPLLLLLCTGAFSQDTLNCQLSSLPLPGDFNIAYGINDAGLIVGDIIVGDNSAEGFGLAGKQAHLFSLSGSTQTIPSDINNRGEVVGSYTDAEQVNHGFLHDASGFHTIDYPGQSENPSTGAAAINDKGAIVGLFGVYFGPGSSQSSFLLQDGHFTEIIFPGAALTQAASINNEGEIAGVYATLGSDNALIFHGFYWNEGMFSTVEYPGATGTSLNGINDSGISIGIYEDAIGLSHPFAFKDGQFFALSFPTTDTIQIYGVNNKNQIVGLEIPPGGSIKSIRAYCHGL
jgi:uncharacterized membrane protein